MSTKNCSTYGTDNTPSFLGLRPILGRNRPGCISHDLAQGPDNGLSRVVRDVSKDSYVETPVSERDFNINGRLQILVKRLISTFSEPSWGEAIERRIGRESGERDERRLIIRRVVKEAKGMKKQANAKQGREEGKAYWIRV